MNGLHKKMEQVRKLKNCMNIQHVINEAHKILGNPIILYDADWKILAHAEGAVTDDPLWNNHVSEGMIDGNVETYLSAGFIDIITSADKAVLLESKQVKYSRIFGKIFDKDDNLLAGISIVASDKHFDSCDLALAEVICKILSDEILKIPYYQGYAQKKLESCINMLIEKEIKDIDDRLYVSGFVEMVYRGLKNNLYLAVADVGGKLEYYSDIFKKTRPAFKYSIYEKYVVIIVSTDAMVLQPKKTFSRLNGIFEHDKIKVGVSSRFENLFDLRKYFHEAVCALNYGLKANYRRHIFLFEECKHDTEIV